MRFLEEMLAADYLFFYQQIVEMMFTRFPIRRIMQLEKEVR